VPKRYALRRQHAPNVFEAFRQVVMLQDVHALAARMGLRPGTLYNKADAGDDSHNQPTLRDVMLVTEITGDTRVLEAMAEAFGRALFDAQAHANTSDEDLLALLTRMGAESGEFHAALARGLGERHFTPAALAAVRAEAMDLVAALMTLLHRLEGYVDAAEATR